MPVRGTERLLRGCLGCSFERLALWVVQYVVLNVLEQRRESDTVPRCGTRSSLTASPALAAA